MIYTKRFVKITTLGIAIITSIFAFSCVSFELTEPAENLQWDINGMIFVQTIESNQGWTEDFLVIFEEISENKYLISAIQDTYYGNTHDQRIYSFESISTSLNQILCQKVEFKYVTMTQIDENNSTGDESKILLKPVTSVINVEESYLFTGEATELFIFDPNGDGSVTWRSTGLTMDIPLVAEAQPEDETTRPAAEYGEPLFDAVASGNLEEVKNLLKNGSDINMRLRAVSGQTPLLTALFENQIEIAEFLIDSGADISITRADGQSALMTVAYLSMVSMVEKLISAGANVNAVKDGGFTPLLIAAEGGSAEVGRLLLEAGADVNATTESNLSALMQPAYQGNIEFVKLLIEYSIDVNIQENSEGLTGLIMAVITNKINIVKLLIDSGSELNAEGKFGTALDTAKDNGYSELVDILTQAGAR